MKKVILDVDTGSDDAVAIMTALCCPNLQVEAICTTWGNLDVEDTTQNTLRLIDRLGFPNVPVYRGCSTAMVHYLYPQHALRSQLEKPPMKDGKALQIHYKELEGLEPTSLKAQEMDAVSFYVNYLTNAKEPVTLIPVGPLTNLGEALSIAPWIVKNIERIVIMGGGDRLANITLCAEANIGHDPEAAEIILQSGADVLFLPLDATHSVALTLDDAATLRALGTFAGAFAARMVEQRLETEQAIIGDHKTSTAIHDALAVCAVIDPSVLTDVQRVRCHVSLLGQTAGETIIDRRCMPDQANCSFSFKGDKQKFMSLLCGFLGKEA